jgi:hypothetical protein
MLKESAVFILYVKGLYATTYPAWVYVSYKYEPLSKMYNSKNGQHIIEKIQTKFPTSFGITKWLYTTSESFASNAVNFIKSTSILENNKHVGKYVKNICPQKLTRAFIHASIKCKLLFPVYCGVGYYMTSKTFENDKKIE